MKTLLYLLVTVLGTVELSSAGTLGTTPQSLPIGKAFPPDGLQIGLGIYNAGAGFGYTNAQVIYRKSQGELKAVIDEELVKLAEKFTLLPGEEAHDYFVWFSVDQYLHGTDKLSTPVANDNYPPTFKLVQGQNGRWKVPAEALRVEIVYNSYIAFLTPGLKWVSVDVGNEGGDLRTENANGTFEGCSTAEGGSNYQGPDVLQLDNQVVLGKFSDGSRGKGSVTLYFSDDRKVFGTYDMETGQLVSSSQNPGLRVVMTPVPNPGKSGIVTHLDILGGVGKSVTAEWSTDFKSWQPLTTPKVSLTGRVTFRDEADINSANRFYRAKLE